MWVEKHVDLQFTHRKASTEVQEAVRNTKQGCTKKLSPISKVGFPCSRCRNAGFPPNYSNTPSWLLKIALQLGWKTHIRNGWIGISKPRKRQMKCYQGPTVLRVSCVPDTLVFFVLILVWTWGLVYFTCGNEVCRSWVTCSASPSW